MPITLLERAAELRVLESAAHAAGEGHGSVVSITGPAGVGKTRLVDAARGIATDRGLQRLTARGSELERGFGFGIVRQLFEHQVAALSGESRERVLDGAAGLAAPLIGQDAKRGQGSPASGSDPEFAALHGLYWLCVNLAASSPLLVAVDDAQWADLPSLRFLSYLSRRVAELPVLVLVSARTGVPGPEALLAAITEGGEHLRPQPLSDRATAELVRSSMGPEAHPDFVAACHLASGGNPFLLSSMLATLRADGLQPSAANAAAVTEIGSAEIVDSVATRLRALPVTSTQLAEAVAVLGNEAELRTAAALADVTDDEGAAAADLLSDAEILAPGRPLDFVHPLVRSAVYERMPPGRRAAAHGRAALLLEGAGAEPEQVALHLMSAEPGAVLDGAARLRRAAVRALERGSLDTAARYLSRALRDPTTQAERSEILRMLGATMLRIGEPGSVAYLRQAMELAPAGPDRATVARELSLGLVPGGSYDEAIAVLEQAASELGDADRELALWIETDIGTEAMLSGATLPVAVQRLLPRLSAVQGASTPGERAALATIAILEASGESDAARAAGHAERAIDRGLLDDVDPGSHVIYNAPYPLVLADRYGEARRALDTVIAASRRRGSLLGVARASSFRANLSYRQGELAEAEAHARTSIEAAPSQWIVRQLSTGWLIEILVERGSTDDARAELEAAGLDGALDDILMHSFPLVSRARLRMALGETDLALEDLRLLDTREAGGRARNPAWFGHRGLMAEALLRAGDVTEARRQALEELALARAWGAPRAIGVAHRAVGLTSHSADDQISALAQAASVLEGTGAALEHARALVDLGAALRRNGRRRDGREPLLDGLDIAHRCGAIPLVERARLELIASGARPRRLLRSGVDALTPSELRVARMAAEGMTNRDIAQALFVTTRTVELHLTGAYRKLDITSRAQLNEALDR